MKWKLLASAPDLEGIKASIARFYCGEEKNLGVPAAEAHRRVSLDLFHKGTVEKVEGVRVIRKNGRWRFEMRGDK